MRLQHIKIKITIHSERYFLQETEIYIILLTLLYLVAKYKSQVQGSNSYMFILEQYHVI